MYDISDYTKQKAKKLNVIVKPSTRKNKKIDVYNSKLEKIASIGDIRYYDYPLYIKKFGKDYADERRKLYHIRHTDNNDVAGKLAKILLW